MWMKYPLKKMRSYEDTRYLWYSQSDFREMKRAAIFTVPLEVLDTQRLLVLW